MPILEIVDRSGRLVQFAPTIIAAVMLSPNDARRRNEIEAAGYADTAIQVDHPTPAKIMAHIHLGPGTNTLLKEAQSQGYLGLIAGQILLFVLRCAAHKPEDASVRKAIEINERALAREAQLQGRKFPNSTAKLRDAWGKYKCVSHLWAALHILEKGEYGLNPENLTEFLGTAEILRRRAERHYPPPKRAKATSLLAPNEAWVAPEILGLPHITFEARALSAQELDWLAEYRAPTK